MEAIQRRVEFWALALQLCKEWSSLQVFSEILLVDLGPWQLLMVLCHYLLSQRPSF